MKRQDQGRPSNTWNRLPPLLWASFSANLLLAGALGWLLLHRTSSASPAPAPQANLRTEIGAKALETQRPPTHDGGVGAAPPAFSWGQLQTPEFPVYIARLRGITCPEATIHDIVKGELDEIYGEKRRKLFAEHGEKNYSRPSSGLRKQLEKLAEEENALLDNLLGVSPEDAVASADEPPVLEPGSRTAQQNQEEALPLDQPLIFQNIDYAAMDLTPEQAETMGVLRANFLKMVGGYSANTNDPEYRQRWRHAQFLMDTQLRMQLGNSFAQKLLSHMKDPE